MQINVSTSKSKHHGAVLLGYALLFFADYFQEIGQTENQALDSSAEIVSLSVRKIADALKEREQHG